MERKRSPSPDAVVVVPSRESGSFFISSATNFAQVPIGGAKATVCPFHDSLSPVCTESNHAMGIRSLS
jgi:hypothetical protein